MAFDPKKYMAPTQKPLPVILMLDVSGSMGHDQKIDRLYDAVQIMVDTFIALEQREIAVQIAAVTFGEEVKLLFPYTPVEELKKQGIPRLVAGGQTPLATALEMVKDMIEDRSVTHGVYAPQVILVSDGRPYPDPNEIWRQRLEEFIGKGRSSKSQRFALAIGKDADQSMLCRFAGTEANVFYAETAADIVDRFKEVTLSISRRSVPSIQKGPFDYTGAFDRPPSSAGAAHEDIEEDDY